MRAAESYLFVGSYRPRVSSRDFREHEVVARAVGLVRRCIYAGQNTAATKRLGDTYLPHDEVAVGGGQATGSRARRTARARASALSGFANSVKSLGSRSLRDSSST